MDKQFVQAATSLKLDLAGTLVQRVSLDGRPNEFATTSPFTHVDASLCRRVYVRVGDIPQHVDRALHGLSWV